MKLAEEVSHCNELEQWNSLNGLHREDSIRQKTLQASPRGYPGKQ